MTTSEKVEQTTTSSPKGFFGSSFFSNVTSSVSAISQTIQTKGLPEINKRINDFSSKGIPEMNKRLTEMGQKARELPSQLASLQGDLESERTSFIEQNKKVDNGAHRNKTIKGSEPVAPWEGYQGYQVQMKKAILDISNDERNFLIPPPEDTSFQFDLNAYSQTAQAALKGDEKLSKMRFLLVPQQVKEPVFWKNYFYRVTIVKQNVLANPPDQEEEEKKDGQVLFDFKDDEDEDKEEHDIEHDLVDTSESEEEEVVVVKKKDIIPEIKPTTKEPENYEGMEDWEIELRKAALE